MMINLCYLLISNFRQNLYIQSKIKDGVYELVTSYMLYYEVFQTPDIVRRQAILQFIEEQSLLYVGDEWKKTVEENAQDIMATGVKFKDACHVASAILAHCVYLITTDKRLQKYHSDRITVINPVDFVMRMEANYEQ